MATTGMCDSFKTELLIAGHNFGVAGDTFKVALVKNAPSRTYDHTQTNIGTPGTGAPATNNLGTDEASGTGYAAGGAALTNVAPALSGVTAVVDFNPDPSWTAASFSATVAIIYNNSTRGGAAGRAVSVHDLGGTQTVASGTFTLVMPTPDASNAILRVG